MNAECEYYHKHAQYCLSDEAPLQLPCPWNEYERINCKMFEPKKAELAKLERQGE